MDFVTYNLPQLVRDCFFDTDVQGAVKFLLDSMPSGSPVGVVMSPRALNPLIRSLESMGIWQSFVVVPATTTTPSRPMYAVCSLCGFSGVSLCYDDE